MIYLQLFYSYIKIGFFGFGGGYPMISLIQSEMVTKHQWLTHAQLADIIAISQMTPGPIAINCATFVGYSVTGNIYGSLLATIATCLPPLSIMLLLVKFYNKVKNSIIMENALKYMTPIMIGMIGSACLMFLDKETFVDWISVVLFILAFIAAWKKINPILIILVSAILGLMIY